MCSPQIPALVLCLLPLQLPFNICLGLLLLPSDLTTQWFLTTLSTVTVASRPSDRKHLVPGISVPLGLDCAALANGCSGHVAILILAECRLWARLKYRRVRAEVCRVSPKWGVAHNSPFISQRPGSLVLTPDPFDARTRVHAELCNDATTPVYNCTWKKPRPLWVGVSPARGRALKVTSLARIVLVLSDRA